MDFGGREKHPFNDVGSYGRVTGEFGGRVPESEAWSVTKKNVSSGFSAEGRTLISASSVPYDSDELRTN